MDNLANINNSDVLPEFQTFLLDKKLVPEKNVPFYAFWISRFFNYAQKNKYFPTNIRKTPSSKYWV